MPRKGQRSLAHAERDRAGKSSGERAGVGGRPTLLDNPEVRFKCVSYAAAGATARDCSRLLGLHPNTVGEWLMRGELAIKEAQVQAEIEQLDELPLTDKYGLFAQDWWAAKTIGRVNALGVLQSSDDPRMVDKWLTRTDEDMQYVDKDRLAGRPEVNLNLPGVNLDLNEALNEAKQARRNAVQGAVVRELPPGDGDGAGPTD